eukprot:TRINITY_DN1955_c0_g1_i1.p1 TRINITY_DN1955_c0_g1~~TRINITY_DN1955_c0_g1_i1.p1  ORF type:complete len:1702 (+),score=452.54 TRINITY_DN1955_c0_g1_i1:104-5209(+)
MFILSSFFNENKGKLYVEEFYRFLIDSTVIEMDHVKEIETCVQFIQKVDKKVGNLRSSIVQAEKLYNQSIDDSKDAINQLGIEQHKCTELAEQLKEYSAEFDKYNEEHDNAVQELITAQDTLNSVIKREKEMMQMILNLADNPNGTDIVELRCWNRPVPPLIWVLEAWFVLTSNNPKIKDGTSLLRSFKASVTNLSILNSLVQQVSYNLLTENCVSVVRARLVQISQVALDNEVLDLLVNWMTLVVEEWQHSRPIKDLQIQESSLKSQVDIIKTRVLQAEQRLKDGNKKIDVLKQQLYDCSINKFTAKVKMQENEEQMNVFEMFSEVILKFSETWYDELSLFQNGNKFQNTLCIKGTNNKNLDSPLESFEIPNMSFEIDENNLKNLKNLKDMKKSDFILSPLASASLLSYLINLQCQVAPTFSEKPCLMFVLEDLAKRRLLPEYYLEHPKKLVIPLIKRFENITDVQFQIEEGSLPSMEELVFIFREDFERKSIASKSIRSQSEAGKSSGDRCKNELISEDNSEIDEISEDMFSEIDSDSSSDNQTTNDENESDEDSEKDSESNYSDDVGSEYMADSDEESDNVIVVNNSETKKNSVEIDKNNVGYGQDRVQFSKRMFDESSFVESTMGDCQLFELDSCYHDLAGLSYKYRKISLVEASLDGFDKFIPVTLMNYSAMMVHDNFNILAPILEMFNLPLHQLSYSEPNFEKKLLKLSKQACIVIVTDLSKDDAQPFLIYQMMEAFYGTNELTHKKHNDFRFYIIADSTAIDRLFINHNLIYNIPFLDLNLRRESFENLIMFETYKNDQPKMIEYYIKLCQAEAYLLEMSTAYEEKVLESVVRLSSIDSIPEETISELNNLNNLIDENHMLLEKCKRSCSIIKKLVNMSTPLVQLCAGITLTFSTFSQINNLYFLMPNLTTIKNAYLRLTRKIVGNVNEELQSLSYAEQAKHPLGIKFLNDFLTIQLPKLGDYRRRHPFAILLGYFLDEIKLNQILALDELLKDKILNLEDLLPFLSNETVNTINSVLQNTSDNLHEWLKDPEGYMKPLPGGENICEFEQLLIFCCINPNCCSNAIESYICDVLEWKSLSTSPISHHFFYPMRSDGVFEREDFIYRNSGNSCIAMPYHFKNTINEETSIFLDTSIPISELKIPKNSNTLVIENVEQHIKFAFYVLNHKAGFQRLILLSSSNNVENIPAALYRHTIAEMNVLQFELPCNNYAFITAFKTTFYNSFYVAISDIPVVTPAKPLILALFFYTTIKFVNSFITYQEINPIIIGHIINILIDCWSNDRLSIFNDLIFDLVFCEFSNDDRLKEMLPEIEKQILYAETNLFNQSYLLSIPNEDLIIQDLRVWLKNNDEQINLSIEFIQKTFINLNLNNTQTKTYNFRFYSLFRLLTRFSHNNMVSLAKLKITQIVEEYYDKVNFSIKQQNCVLKHDQSLIAGYFNTEIMKNLAIQKLIHDDILKLKKSLNASISPYYFPAFFLNLLLSSNMSPFCWSRLIDSHNWLTNTPNIYDETITSKMSNLDNFAQTPSIVEMRTLFFNKMIQTLNNETKHSVLLKYLKNITINYNIFIDTFGSFLVSLQISAMNTFRVHYPQEIHLILVPMKFIPPKNTNLITNLEGVILTNSNLVNSPNNNELGLISFNSESLIHMDFQLRVCTTDILESFHSVKCITTMTHLQLRLTGFNVECPFELENFVVVKHT